MQSEFKTRLLFRLRYLVKTPWDSGVSPPELLDFIAENPPGRALDLGCGTGTNVITLAQNGWEVRGIDFVPKAIRSGKRKARRAGVQVELLVGDVIDLNLYQGPYDLILDMGCYHVLNQKQRTVYQDNLVKALAPGGTFLLYSFLNRTPEQTFLSEQEIDAFSKLFKLTDRQDGEDKGGGAGYASVWLWFKAETQEQP